MIKIRTTLLFFWIDLCWAISMESSRRYFLNDMAEHWYILENYQNAYHPRLIFTPKTGEHSLMKTFRFYRVCCNILLKSPWQCETFTFTQYQVLLSSSRAFVVENIYYKSLIVLVGRVSSKSQRHNVIEKQSLRKQLDESPCKTWQRYPCSFRFSSNSAKVVWYVTDICGWPAPTVLLKAPLETGDAFYSSNYFC